MKIFILAASDSDSRLAFAFTLLAISMILINLSEFIIAITYLQNPILAGYALNAIMAFLGFMAYSLLHFCLTVSKVRHAKIVNYLSALIAISLFAALVTGSLVEGYEQAGYSIISVPGSYYPVFSIYAVSCVLISLSALFYAMLKAHPTVSGQCLHVQIISHDHNNVWSCHGK